MAAQAVGLEAELLLEPAGRLDAAQGQGLEGRRAEGRRRSSLGGSPARMGPERRTDDQEQHQRERTSSTSS